jgi:SAM-dependent methyltransferase
VIEHIGDTDGLLREIRRVLKDDGYAVLSTPNLAAFTTIAFLLIGKQPTMISATDWRDGKKNSFHRRLFTLSGLKNALAANGFYIEKEVCSCYYPVPTILSGLFSRIDKRHTACMTVKIRKDIA